MSLADNGVSAPESAHGAAIRLPCAQRSLHRLALVRQQQGVTRRTVARRLGIDVSSVKWQEQASSDMLLSRLYEWQQVLEVPVAELLVETDEPLSAPVLKRAQMVRLMKTAAAILEHSQQVGIRRMAQTLVAQMIEIMPELADVSPWHTIGRRRTKDEVGQAACRRLATEFFKDLGD